MQGHKTKSVFKPMQSQESTNFFSFEASQPKQRQASATSLETEGQGQKSASVERLTSLHARLHQEADKIRRWKTQTEIEIKQKDTKLQECNKTLESLRKSMLELQFHNENLSMKLQEEIDSRQEITLGIQSTREMCNILKDHSTQIDDRIQKCETDKMELKYLEKEHSKQFEEMSGKFEKLDLSTSAKITEVTEKLKHETTERETMERMWKERMEETEGQIQSLLSQCKEKDIKISEITEELGENGRRLAETLSVLDTANDKICSTETEYHEQSVVLHNALDDLSHLRNEKVMLETELETKRRELADLMMCKRDMEVEFEGWKQSNDNTLLSLREEINGANGNLEQEKQKEINGANGNLEQEKQKVKASQQQFEKALSQIAELTNAKDVLIMEKSELDCKLSDLANSLEKVQNELSAAENKIQSTEAECMGLNEKVMALQKDINISKLGEAGLRNQVSCLQDEQKNFKATIVTLNQDIEVKQSEITELQNKCDSSAEEIAQLKSRLETSEGNYELISIEYTQLSEKLEISECEKIAQENVIADKQRSLDILGEQFEASESIVRDLRKHLEQLTSDRDNFRQNVKSLEEVLQIEKEKSGSLLEEKQSHDETMKEELDAHSKSLKDLEETMKEELDAHSKSSKDLENKTKSLKSDVTVKNKQIKDLEKEIKSLKTTIEKSTKSNNSLNADLEEQCKRLDDTTKQYDQLNTELVNVQRVHDEQTKLVNSLKLTAAKMEKSAEVAIQDKEEACTKYEYEMKEMMATLEKYQHENSRIVEQKEREVEKLKEEAEQRALVADKDNRSSNELKDKYDGVLAELQTVQQERDSRMQTSSCEIEELEAKYKTIVESKEQEIESLNSETTHLKAKLSDVEQSLSKLNSEKTTADTWLQPLKTMSVSSMVVPSTPKPKVAEVKATPQNRPTVPSTPRRTLINLPDKAAVLMTPQRSILKQNQENTGKKRKVSFEPEMKASDNDTSGSEGMEVELYDDKSSSSKTTSTPVILLKQSPRVKGGTKTPRAPVKANAPTTPALKPVPRGPSVASAKAKKESEKKENKAIESIFSRPALKPFDTNANQGPKTRPAANSTVRQTPAKTTPASKLLKYSPTDRRAQNRAMSLKKQKTDWFDETFGFEMED